VKVDDEVAQGIGDVVRVPCHGLERLRIRP
jgi:hypothetical protein